MGLMAVMLSGSSSSFCQEAPQAFAAFLAPGNPEEQGLILWEMQQWERENQRE